MILYETYRAFEVVEFTEAAHEAIGASDLFSFPLLGPIACGAIAGCGGTFLPLDKGLRPLNKGLVPSMTTALIGAAFYNIFVHSSWGEEIVDAKEKAHFVVASFFVLYGLYSHVELSNMLNGIGAGSDAGVMKKEH